ncbi:MAG: SGNH/GDSL hydrolase family protein, partial [Clostridia bacterium]|nr:SGNH/GDSL hydrolase family protein [Clostridia bacterium]
HTPDIDYFVQKSEKADKSYFDDAVFVGDSVTQIFKTFEMQDNALGNALFLCATSLSPYNVLWSLDRKGNVHPSYNGEKVRVPQGIKKSGKKKVYIMLGINGIGGGAGQQNVNCLKQLVDEIKALVPDATFYMQSVLPVNKKCKYPTKKDIDIFNKALSKACKDYGWYYIDVASAFADKDGYLPTSLCAEWDPQYFHPNKAGYNLWAEYILTHTV